MNSRILFGVTYYPSAFVRLDGPLAELSKAHTDVHLVCGMETNHELDEFAERNTVTVHGIRLARDPEPLTDARALVRLVQIVGKLRPDSISVGTPKMSLLLCIAAKLRRVPRRIYVCHGLRFEGFTGPKRRIARFLELITCLAATQVVPVSNSVRNELLAIGVPSSRIRFLGWGSADGVHPKYFKPATDAAQNALLSELELQSTDPVVTFVGRLTRDKGIAEILAAAKQLPHVTFLLAGSTEPSGHDDVIILSQLRALKNVRVLGRRSDLENVYAVSDLLLLPSIREGLPTVVLEAAGGSVPTVAMDATGTRDLVFNNRTGLIVEQGNTPQFVRSIRHLIDNPDERHRLGQNARQFVAARFDQRSVRDRWTAFYLGLDNGPMRTATSHDSGPDSV